MRARQHRAEPEPRHAVPRPPPVPEHGFLQELQRTVGNAAVAQLVARARNSAVHAPARSLPASPAPSRRPEPPGTRSEPRTAVQRYAFVDGEQVEPKRKGLSRAQKKFASDDTVRDYDGDAEFADHAKGKTDYLGTLPKPSKGTWVRFSPTGTNVIGEDHTQVTLPHIVKAVGSTSFIYEGFTTDDFAGLRRTRKSYLKSRRGMRKAVGLKHTELRSHGAEPLRPKMAQALGELLEHLMNGSLRRAEPYLGPVMQEYLKHAWAYGKDLRKGSNTEEMSTERRRLVELNGEYRKPLGKFVENLKHGGSLIAQAEKLAEADDLRRQLGSYIRAVINEIWASNPPATTQQPYDERDKAVKLEGQRDEHLRANARLAADHRQRYVGMGNKHVASFEPIAQDSRFHFYDMTGQHLREFRERTEKLKNQARR